jgi:hypothetical protein
MAVRVGWRACEWEAGREFRRAWDGDRVSRKRRGRGRVGPREGREWHASRGTRGRGGTGVKMGINVGAGERPLPDRSKGRCDAAE